MIPIRSALLPRFRSIQISNFFFLWDQYFLFFLFYTLRNGNGFHPFFTGRILLFSELMMIVRCNELAEFRLISS
jgi:hypothetical protein